MKDNERQFEDFVARIKFDDTADPNHRDRLERDLLSALKKGTARQGVIWRTIMKTKITKLATAAAVILIAVLGITILDKSAAPVWAIEQTIEAMRKINTIHAFVTDFDGKRIEMWMKVNPETGDGEYLYLDASETEHGLIVVSTPKEVYHYDKNRNVVTHGKGQTLTTPIRFGRFIEDADKWIKSKGGSIQINRKYDPKRAKEVIVLLAEADKHAFEATIDPESNLPLYVNYIRCERYPNNMGKSVDEIYYDEALPEGIFEFEIPEGAKVIEKQED
ncbi:MAG: hypothetical protein ACYTBV_20235 [Planctomycetota bacterium]|jgi:outer membrane lipoprotein-sorting protein